MRSAGRFALRWASADIRFFVFSNSDFTDYPFFSCTFYKHPLFSPNPFNQKKQLNLYIYIYIKKCMCIYNHLFKDTPKHFPPIFSFWANVGKVGVNLNLPRPPLHGLYLRYRRGLNSSAQPQAWSEKWQPLQYGKVVNCKGCVHVNSKM